MFPVNIIKIMLSSSFNLHACYAAKLESSFKHPFHSDVFLRLIVKMLALMSSKRLNLRGVMSA